MKRALLPTSRFERGLRRMLKRQPELADEIAAQLAALADDAFAASLRTHKLRGKLKGLFASTFGYDLRIVFEIIVSGDGEAVSLLMIGTHDEVY